MSLGMRVVGTMEAAQAMRDVPRRVQLRHVRIGLNKGAGMLRGSVSSMTPRDTGALAKSYKIKVKVPDASFNKAHHGKPAYAVIGASRQKRAYRRRTSEGRLIGHGAANKSFAAELKAGTKLGQARRTVENTFKDAIYRAPSRYAHIVEKGRKAGRRGGAQQGRRMHEKAVRIAGPAAQVATIQKIRDGVIMEANLAYARSIGKFR
jgi:hypothetical protein